MKNNILPRHNIYWPVYKNIESEFVKLMYCIHIDDKQLNVYSSLISDLIIRSVVEVESISKELYKENGGTKTENIKYDDDAIHHLKKIWMLDKKVLYLASPNCFLSQKTIFPFVKNEEHTLRKPKKTYSWNNAYQNLKHDRFNSLEFGSIRYLIDAMAALFILNIYYKDERIDLGDDRMATTFPVNLGSEIFSISLAKWAGYSAQGDYHKAKNFDESIYFAKWHDECLKKYVESAEQQNKKFNELFIKHSKFKEFIMQNKGKTFTLDSINPYNVLGKEEYFKFLGVVARASPIYNQEKTEAVVNKHQI